MSAASSPAESSARRSASPSPSPGPPAPPEDHAAQENGGTSSSTRALAAVPRSRPARPQITQAKLDAIRDAQDKGNQTGTTYNVWYNKWVGGDRDDDARNNVKAPTRCDIARDAGYTRADASKGAPYCLFFARGLCPRGAECQFLHRLPPTDYNPEQGRDIFGREKHGDYKDDMGGVGSLQRVNRTLYVGRIVEEPHSSSRGGGANIGGLGAQWRDGGRTVKGGKSVGDALRSQGKQRQHLAESPSEKVLRRHFEEWGEIERVRVLHGRSCGFVTYVSESAAQFAKEAMHCQSMDHNEVLNVRWSTIDPNPAAQRRDRKQLVAEGRQAIADALTDEQRAAGRALALLEAQSDLLDDDDQDDDDQDGGDGEGDGTDSRKAQRREQRAAKRRRILHEEEELWKLEEENARAWRELERERAEEARKAAVAAQEAERERVRAAAAVPAHRFGAGPADARAPGGLLNADALGGLQALASLRQGQVKVPVAAVKTAPATAASNGLGALAGYGSDSD